MFEDIKEHYIKSKSKKRLEAIKQLDSKLFDDYYKIYERIRLKEYGIQKLYRDTLDLVGRDAFYEWSENLAYKYNHFVKQDKTKKVLKSGVLPLCASGAMLALGISNVLPSVSAVFCGAFALGMVGAVQHAENKYAQNNNLNVPYVSEYCNNKFLDIAPSIASHNIQNLAAQRFRDEHPINVYYYDEEIEENEM